MPSFAVRDTNDEDAINKVTYNMRHSLVNVINRGNPTSDNTLLLNDFNTIHYYNYSGSAISEFSIPTEMVENAIYEVDFSCSGSSEGNNDMTLTPSSNESIVSHYYSVYNASYEDGETQSVNYVKTSSSIGFFFDFFLGFNGYDPVGKLTIYNDRACKKITLNAGDTSSSISGLGYWLNDSVNSENYLDNNSLPPEYNTTSKWTSIGLLKFGDANFAHWRIRVSRVG